MTTQTATVRKVFSRYRKSKRSLPRYVFERDGWYYFRLRIPAELTAIIGQDEFKEALRTKDLSEAKLLAERKAVETSTIVEIACRRVPPRSLRQRPRVTSDGEGNSSSQKFLDWMTEDERRYVAQRSGYDLVWIDDTARLNRLTIGHRDLYLDQRYEQYVVARDGLNPPDIVPAKRVRKRRQLVPPRADERR